MPDQVKSRLERFAQVVTARELGREAVPDKVAYALAVRDRFDLVVTCNSERRTAFRDEALRHLSCREKDLPVPVYELHEPNSNQWPVLERRWDKHEARIRQELTDLGQKHERRRDEAIAKLDRLEQAAGRTEQQLTRTITHER
ncbi:hypothetical protein J0H58_16655 [bacterium]|nr:hypothetical protein [bacterium]